MALTIGTITPFKSFGMLNPRFAANVAVTASSVAATTITSLTGAVPGLTTDMVLVIGVQSAPTVNAQVVAGRCSAANVLQLDYVNPTGGAVTPDAFTYTIMGI